MRSFQFSDASSHKFWSIDVRGAKHVIKFGKVGAAGQTQEKTFPTPELAQAEADKLIREKTRKGYAETTPGAGSSSTADALENAIRANPDDRAAHAAYADYLTEQGDPRGEFIQVQLALEDESLKAAERKKLQKREADLLAKHEKEWVGAWADKVPAAEKWFSDGLDPLGGRKFAFERGLLTTINAGRLTVNGVRAIAADPATRFVRNLYVGTFGYDEPDDDGAFERGPDIPAGATYRLGQYPLARWPHLKNVRRLMWGWPAEASEDGHAGEHGDHYYNCHVPADCVSAWVKQAPDIEELHVCAHFREDMNKVVVLPMPRLRTLVLYHGWTYPLDKLAANKSLTNLTTLLCQPHMLEHDDPPYIRLKHLKAVCQSPHLTALTHLRLRCSDLGDKGAQEIASSGILKRLRVLDLQHGCITDKGAEALAASPDLPKPKVLNVSANALTAAGVKALKKTGVTLIAGHMHETTKYDPDDENEFLWQGDGE